MNKKESKEFIRGQRIKTGVLEFYEQVRVLKLVSDYFKKNKELIEPFQNKK